MLVGEHGYVPEPYFLTETLRSQARFHDPLQDSLFSHSSSVEGFRQWSSSGGSSPSNAEAIPFAPQPTLLVRSSRPLDAPLAPSPTRRAAQPLSVKVSDDVYESRVPSLVTPRNVIAGGVGKRVRYGILEVTQALMMKHLYDSHPYSQWHPLLDSSNIEIEGRARARPCSQASDPISFSW